MSNRATPGLDLDAIRAEAIEHCTATGRYGITNRPWALVLQLVDHIDRSIPWRAVHVRNEGRRRHVRARWQRRPVMRQPGLDWARDHRTLVLADWEAIELQTPDGIHGATLWLIPVPGAEKITRVCPHCGNRRGQDRARRGCAHCRHTGFLTITKGSRQ